MKVAIRTLGCKVNQAESAVMEGQLHAADMKKVDSLEDADVCIINTCTVTAKSDAQSRQLIRRAARAGAKVIATGCYAELRRDEIIKTEGLSKLVCNSSKGSIISIIHEVTGNDANSQDLDHPTDQPDKKLITLPYKSSRSRALLKIQDGCNFSCSYCTVPLARGRSRSLDIDSVVKSAGKLVDSGYKEIILTGVHIGLYGLDLETRTSLSGLILLLAAEYPQTRFRLSSIEPQELTSAMLGLIEKGSVCPHLHIPLQSGSDKILKLMNRRYDTKSYKQLINRIITSYPPVSIGTDLIMGFPGESDKDFNDTVKFVNSLPLSYLHVFPYSKRPHTRAIEMSDQVDDHVKRSRVKALIEVSSGMKSAYKLKQLGNKLDVIIEKRVPNHKFYYAISGNYLRVIVNSTDRIKGERLKVIVTSLTDDEIFTEPLK